MKLSAGFYCLEAAVTMLETLVILVLDTPRLSFTTERKNAGEFRDLIGEQIVSLPTHYSHSSHSEADCN